VLLALPLLLVLGWPALLNRLITWGLRLLRRAPLEETLSPRAILTTVALYALAWVLFGAHILVLALAVGGGSGVTVASLSGYALAGSLGMLTVILPAGLGARDGILAIVLASAMPLSAGTAVALVSRFVVTLVDVLAAAGGWAYARRHHLVASRAELERRAETLVSDDPVADDPLIDKK
jgi:glycosyltransferase 2 family protein